MSELAFKLSAVIFLIFLSTSAYAINLGSSQKNDFSEMSSLDSAVFKMLFWNVENETYTVSLSAQEYPKDWTIMIDPSEFSLNRETGEEYINLPYTQEIIKAKTVKIFVKPDEKSPAGPYNIVISSETNLPEMNATGMNIISERLFRFGVNITGPVFSENQTEQKRVEYVYNISGGGDHTSLATEASTDKTNFYVLVIFLVGAISIILYKKYK